MDWIFMSFFLEMYLWTKKSRVNFGSQLDPDSGIFNRIFTTMDWAIPHDVYLIVKFFTISGLGRGLLTLLLNPLPDISVTKIEFPLHVPDWLDTCKVPSTRCWRLHRNNWWTCPRCCCWFFTMRFFTSDTICCTVSPDREFPWDARTSCT